MSEKREVILKKIKEYRKKVGNPAGDNVTGVPAGGSVNTQAKEPPPTSPFTGKNISTGTGSGAPINEGEYPHVY
jgi:hypothetical protein